MSGTHANSRFPVFGTSLLKLPNNRFRITVRCDVVARDKSWYYANKDNFWKDFGDLYTSELTIDGSTEGWEAHDGEAYPDMRLVETDFDFIPGRSAPVLTFIYETLNGTWTKENDDTTRSLANGLRVLQRVQVATSGTAAPFDEDDVGVETITDNGKTLYLASIDNQSTEQIGRFVTQWAEPGTLRVSKEQLGDGAVKKTTTYLVLEPATTDPVVSRSTQDFQGLQTITVTTIVDKDDAAIASYTHTYETIRNFTYPGKVSIETTTISSIDGSTNQDAHFLLQGPVTRPVEATVTVTYSTTSTLSPSDLPFSPDTWARGRYYGHGRYGRAFIGAQAFNGYLAADVDGSGLVTTKSLTGAASLPGLIASIMGNRVYGGTTGRIDIFDGDTTYPSGSTVIDADHRLAWTDIDGTEYWKKTLVTATL